MSLKDSISKLEGHMRSSYTEEKKRPPEVKWLTPGRIAGTEARKLLTPAVVFCDSLLKRRLLESNLMFWVFFFSLLPSQGFSSDTLLQIALGTSPETLPGAKTTLLKHSVTPRDT